MKNTRALPSVDLLLSREPAQVLRAQIGRKLLLQAIREVLDDIRNDKIAGTPDIAEILNLTSERIQSWLDQSLVPVINATGVIIHTNLGRSPLSTETVQAMSAVSCNFNTLEFDLSKGVRGSRYVHALDIIKRVTGAESALVVNNNAGAVLLILSAVASRKKAAISRSQLVEIGGGFRVPDVMRQSGVKMIEVGTTNRTRLSDFQDVLDDGVRVIVRAHPSNYKIIGFTEEPDYTELVKLAHRYEAIVIDDLGSGCLLDTSAYGLTHEPTIQESLSAGSDIVCFSGDKLIGGPQAGIILGSEAILKVIRKHPLARAVRADKTCLAGIQATLTHYLKDEVERKVPIWKMISMSTDIINQRAVTWQSELKVGEVKDGLSTIGGGSLPGETLPTRLWVIPVKSPQAFLARLRKLATPIIARVEKDEVVFDPRTIFPEQDELFMGLIRQVLNQGDQR